MGRRKIEIKAIKDDRNRSVTFLKRKGGLFKKAHELSVLCSVDVAVIIFGQNKKLYEFSSGDINQTLSHYQYYGQPHERKGPADFADKGGGDDDEDEDEPMGSPGPQERQSPPHHGVVQHPLQTQPGMQHMRHSSTPSASPPMRNGAFQGHRMSTPQPSSGPRPDSRTHMRRQSSNLVPQNHPHPQATQPMQQSMAYGYQPQAPFYNYNQAAATANMQQQQQQQQNQQQQQQQQQPPHSTPPTQQHHNFTHPPPNSQMQQLYLQEQRRQSMPSSLASHNRQQMPSMHAPLQPSRPFQSPPLPEPGRAQPPVKNEQDYSNTGERQQQAPRQWEPITLAQPVPSDQRPSREESLPRPSSIDVGSAMRYNPDAPESHARYGPPPPPTAPVRPPVRSLSGSTMGAPGPTRVNSLQSDAKRPQLRVQIPGEASDEASSADEASPKDTSKSTMATPAKPGALEPNHASGIVLPAPSPRSASAGAVLSAGATGPANPFARPNIPSKQPSNNEWKDGVASPMSALPSRVMGESGYMSSPSSMFPELGFGSMQSNTLASPAIYQPTPINFHGPSFRDEPADKDKDKEKEKRRKSPDEPDGPNKKAKS